VIPDKLIQALDNLRFSDKVHFMNTRNINQELEIFVLYELNKKPDNSQRELAKKLNISLGKINFVINFVVNELSKKGYIKITRFVSSKHKARYYYILTPVGIREKVSLTRDFVKRKIAEYERLLEE